MKVIFDYDSGRRKAIIQSDLLSNIREHFSVEDKSQKFRRRFTFGHKGATRTYAITPQGRFDARLINEVVRHIRETYTSVVFEYTPTLSQHLSTPSLRKDNVFALSITENQPLRDYQLECVQQSLEMTSGLIILPTSAGKTMVMATLIMSIQSQLADNFKTLVLVPDTGLVTQTYQDFLDYGVPSERLTKWTGTNTLDDKASIIIANSQILLSEKQDTSILKQIQLLVIDEVHKIKQGNKISKLVSHIPAKLRYGLTGTLPEDLMDRWFIMGQLGDIIYSKKSIEMREQKYITNVKVVVLKVTYFNPPRFEIDYNNPTAAYEQENTYLHSNQYRNDIIKNIVSQLNKNTLILVDRIVHGEILLEVLKQLTDKEVYFISGVVELVEREKIRALMETKDNIICVAISKIFSTGVNIKNLHYIFFASIGKAKIKIIQSIGRSLRLHANKKQATIFDIGDNLKYGNKHLQERLSLYAEEEIPFIIKEINQNEK